MPLLLNRIITVCFYFSFFNILYINLFYPLLLCIIAAWKKKKSIVSSTSIDPADLPSVTLIISAYNEESAIQKKILNSLALDYPKGKIEIFVVSDGSTDTTDDIVKKYADKGIVLLRVEGRLGKTACQNIAVNQASGEILIYSDATSIYAPASLLHIVVRFQDLEVGCVVGRVCSEIELTKRIAVHEEAHYLKFSQWIKELEDSVTMPVGASGAMFAIKRKYLVELPPYANDDLLRPLSVVQQGGRIVYEKDAVACEKIVEDYNDIFRKKIRIGRRAAFSIKYIKPLLNPMRYGFFSIQLLTKILLRRLLLPNLVLLFLSSIFLMYSIGGKIYGMVVVLILSALVLALLGFITSRFCKNKKSLIYTIPRFCYYYLLAITGAFLGIFYGFFGKEIVDWRPNR